MPTRTFLFALVVLLCVVPIGAFAGPVQVVSVANSSFETLPNGGLPYGGCGTGCSYSGGGNIPDWAGSGGQFQPGSSSGNYAYFNYVPDGLTVAYSNGGTISQNVGTSAANAIYTLTVEQGSRYDVPDPGQVFLQIGGHNFLATGTPAPAYSGNWATFTATGFSANAGAPITILLSSPGVQADWDNVKLSYTVPEPATSSLAFFTVGIAGVLGMLRRKFRL